MASLSRGSRDSMREVTADDLSSGKEGGAGLHADQANEKGILRSKDDDRAKDDEIALQQMGIANQMGKDGGVRRDLKSRHLAMIALGGTIGTGLFVGLGSSLAQAGPLSTLLGFLIMGVSCVARQRPGDCLLAYRC